MLLDHCRSVVVQAFVTNVAFLATWWPNIN